MNNEPDRSTEYIDFLLSLKEKMSNITASNQDKIWLNTYKKLMLNDGFSEENLPFLLALIHPDFYYKNNDSFSESIGWWKDGSFTRGITETSKCEINKISHKECAFNKFPEIRGKCQADHFWPNSLGGPSILENRLIICKFHNAMKSNDILHFNWGKFPEWLKNIFFAFIILKSKLFFITTHRFVFVPCHSSFRLNAREIFGASI